MVKILLVDDDANKSKNIELIIREILPDEELNLIKAVNISDANSALNTQHFDLMLLDLNLPMRNNSTSQPSAGIKFLDQLGRRGNSINIPTHIIGLTAFDELLTNYQTHFKERGWILIKYEQSTDEWEKIITEKICHILNSSGTKKMNWSEIKYFVIFLCLLLILFSIWIFLGMKHFLIFTPIVIIVFYCISLFQLRNDNKLSEKNFITLSVELLKIVKSKLLDTWNCIFNDKNK